MHLWHSMHTASIRETLHVCQDTNLKTTRAANRPMELEFTDVMAVTMVAAKAQLQDAHPIKLINITASPSVLYFFDALGSTKAR
jgi:hypothetical protein